MLEALAELDTRLQGTPARLVNIIHDELVLECPESFADQAKSILEEAMHCGFMTMFPSASYMLHDLVEMGIGKSWQDAKS
jgi:DNA polymerase I-like protein with 3'-5' exonuclease and polymerase domains